MNTNFSTVAQAVTRSEGDTVAALDTREPAAREHDPRHRFLLTFPVTKNLAVHSNFHEVFLGFRSK